MAYPDALTISVKCQAAPWGEVGTFFGRYTKLQRTGQDAKPIYQHEDGTDEDGEKKYLFYKDGVWNCGTDYESGKKAYLRSEPTENNIPPTGWLYRQQLTDEWTDFPMLMCLPEDNTNIIESTTTEIIPVNNIPPSAISPPSPITEPSLPWTTVYFSPQGPDDGTKLVRDNLLTTLPSLGKEWRVTHEFRPTDYSAKGWTNSLHLTTGGNKKRMPAIFFHASKGMVVAFPKDDSSNTKHYIKGDDRPATNEWNRIKISQELLDQKYMITITIGCKKVFSVQNNKPNEYSEVMVYASNPFYAAQPGSIKNLIIETKTNPSTGYIHE